MYILKNCKKINEYKYSNIEILLQQFENVIKETLCFFERKRRTDVIKFLESSYLDILEIYNIVKITLKDENVDKFKEVEKNKDTIKEEIENKALYLIDEIEKRFQDCKKIENNINLIYDEYSFDTKFQENKEGIDNLVNETNEKTLGFENDLKKYIKI